MANSPQLNTKSLSLTARAFLMGKFYAIHRQHNTNQLSHRRNSNFSRLIGGIYEISQKASSCSRMEV